MVAFNALQFQSRPLVRGFSMTAPMHMLVDDFAITKLRETADKAYTERACLSHFCGSLCVL